MTYPKPHQKSELPLSAVSELSRGRSRSADEPATVIRAELRRISVARRRRARATERRHIDRLIDYVWGGVA